MQSSSNFIHPLKLSSTHNQNTAATKTVTIPKQCCRFSRREVAICTNASLLLLIGEPLLGISRARADEENLEKPNQFDPEKNPTKTDLSDDNLKLVEPEETRLETANPDSFSQIKPDETRIESENQDSLNRIEPGETRMETANQESLSQIEQDENRMETENSDTKPAPKRAFIEVAIDGEPIGKIVIELYNDTSPVGASRFSNLVSGKAGISYRRKEFVKITPNYVQHGGVRSYGVDAELASKTGTSLGSDSLVEEWEKQYGSIAGPKNVAGSVSLIVRDPSKPPPKMKLVARKGKLEIDEEEVGKDPNGTEFVISVRNSPELDESALVIGRVLEGMDVAERIAQVKTVKENTTSPYFRVAKLIGDKRAVVAERGFNRPYSKVQILNCGFID